MLNDGNGAHERGNDGPEGTVYQAALRSALATTNYILSGEGIEEYHPSHTYYGFRYIQITADAPRDLSQTDWTGRHFRGKRYGIRQDIE